MDENTVYSSDFVDISEQEKPSKKKHYKPFGIVSMVFGILSLASYFTTVSLPLTFLFPLIGLTFASFDLKRNKERTPFGLVGYITSLIAFIIEILIALYFIFMVALMVLLFMLTFSEISIL